MRSRENVGRNSIRSSFDEFMKTSKLFGTRGQRDVKSTQCASISVKNFRGILFDRIARVQSEDMCGRANLKICGRWRPPLRVMVVLF